MSADATKANPTSQPKRRWFRFSLRTLFLATALVALLLTYEVLPTLDQKRAVNALKGDGTFLTVQYDYQFDYYQGKEKGKPAPEPAWLARIFGVDAVHNIVRVDLIGKGTATRPQQGFASEDFKQALPALKYLPRLQFLFISTYKAKLDDQDFASLEQLHHLQDIRIFGGQIGNGTLQHLRNLGALESLVVENNRIDDDGLADLAKLTNLKMLDLYDNQISGPGLRHLAGLVNLEELILAKNQISGEGLKYIAKLPKLRMLILDDNPIVDDDLKSIATIPNLEQWAFANTKLTNASIDTLAKVHNTARFEESTPVQFTLSNTAITMDGFKRLHELRPEAIIYIQGLGFNDFSNTDPVQFPPPEEQQVQTP